MGGHIVQGHVDTVGMSISVATEGDFAVYRWRFPAEFADLVVQKGSIAVDGVSLTVVEPDGDTFGAALIPETLLPNEPRHGAASATGVNLSST